MTAKGKRTATISGAKISHDNDGDGVPEDIEDCDFALICTPGGAGDCPQDIAIEKTVQAAPCWPGFDCTFSLDIRNIGSAAHQAIAQGLHGRALDFARTLPNPASLTSQALIGSAKRDAPLAEIVEVAKLFFHLIPGLVTNIAFFRHQLLDR